MALNKSVGLFVLSLICLFSLIGPELSQKSYFETAIERANEPPSFDFWFGTDDLGRDLFTRCAFGARISLFVGLVAGLIDLGIGVFFGSISAIYGGKVDLCMMRFADILYAIPSLLMVILLIVVFEASLLTLILAISLTGWVTMARIVRGKIYAIKQESFILAATSMGAGPCYLLFKHLLPNAKGAIFATLLLSIPSAIFQEAFLSFLGLGIQAPMASLGTLASDALPAISYYPWQLFFPAACITLSLFSFYLLGDSLDEKAPSLIGG